LCIVVYNSVEGTSSSTVASVDNDDLEPDDEIDPQQRRLGESS